MEKPQNCIIVIFGASGDLTKRKLMPSLFDLFRRDLLPEKFAVLGVSRTIFSDESFRDKMAENVNRYCRQQPVEQSKLQEFIKRLFYFPLDSVNTGGYPNFKNKLNEVDSDFQTNGNFIYYLSTSPKLFEKIAKNLASVELNQQNGNWKRIVVEKPIGFDLDSAKLLNDNLQKVFNEDQIYRIDHYLGKETVQNIVAFRFANGIFEPLWNRNYIHHVEVTSAESIGVEDRGGYYDSAGALRDMVQNHLLQVVATIAMEPPSKFDATAVRNEKVKVLQSLCPLKFDELEKSIVLGQYLASTIRGENVLGYREEKDVPKDSRTETFAALKFHIDNWRWGGVPFFIRTGKRLPTRVTEIAIHFKKTPHAIFSRQFSSKLEDNQLIIRIQPDEGILLKFGMKLPGAGFQIKTVAMDFHYSDLSGSYVPEAYERLLLDCMLGDATLYARADEVEASWSFLNPILEAKNEENKLKLYSYPAGTWGPKKASELFDDSEEDWRYPCKNLVNDGDYCEL